MTAIISLGSVIGNSARHNDAISDGYGAHGELYGVERCDRIMTLVTLSMFRHDVQKFPVW